MTQYQSIDTITFAKFRELSQSAIWKTLRDNIAEDRVAHITMTESQELKNSIDFPHIIVSPPTGGGDNVRVDYDTVEKNPKFYIKIISTSETDFIELSDLVVKILDANQSVTRTIGLSQFKHIDTTDDVKWVPNTDKKKYTSIVVVNYRWTG